MQATCSVCGKPATFGALISSQSDGKIIGGGAYCGDGCSGASNDIVLVLTFPFADLPPYEETPDPALQCWCGLPGVDFCIAHGSLNGRRET